MCVYVKNRSAARYRALVDLQMPRNLKMARIQG